VILKDIIAVGMSAERSVTVTEELTVGHFVDGMPKVYATPMMILLMELASGAAISPHLPPGYVSVGTEVNVRHLAATPVGRVVRAVARVSLVEARSVVFDVEAFDGDRRIGAGTHGRGVVDTAKFKLRFGAD
jgi:predicted thioesterase